MSQRVIRLAQLASTKTSPGMLPVSQATVWRWVREKKFPAPFKLGEGTTVWAAEAVEAFIAAQQTGGKK